VSLSPAEQSIIEEAIQLGVLDAARTPSYLPGWSCTLMSFGLALPTLGFSLVFVPLIWVAQHEHTGSRITKLRERLKSTGGPAADHARAMGLAGNPGAESGMGAAAN
jgi:hypothetical protein